MISNSIDFTFAPSLLMQISELYDALRSTAEEAQTATESQSGSSNSKFSRTFVLKPPKLTPRKKTKGGIKRNTQASPDVTPPV
jgi:hypothetical protein